MTFMKNTCGEEAPGGTGFAAIHSSIFSFSINLKKRPTTNLQWKIWIDELLFTLFKLIMLSRRNFMLGKVNAESFDVAKNGKKTQKKKSNLSEKFS